MLYGNLHRRAGRNLRELCEQRGVELNEGNAQADHIHLCLSIPPKYNVSHTIGFLKEKSAVRIHRELLRERRVTGLHFWARLQSLLGKHLVAVRDYDRAITHLRNPTPEYFLERATALVPAGDVYVEEALVGLDEAIRILGAARHTAAASNRAGDSPTSIRPCAGASGANRSLDDTGSLVSPSVGRSFGTQGATERLRKPSPARWLISNPCP